jgi:hypothetical protein
MYTCGEAARKSQRAFWWLPFADPPQRQRVIALLNQQILANYRKVAIERGKPEHRQGNHATLEITAAGHRRRYAAGGMRSK